MITECILFKHHKMKDNVLLHVPAKTTQECAALQNNLTAVSCWSDRWQLALNPY